MTWLELTSRWYNSAMTSCSKGRLISSYIEPLTQFILQILQKIFWKCKMNKKYIKNSRQVLCVQKICDCTLSFTAIYYQLFANFLSIYCQFYGKFLANLWQIFGKFLGEFFVKFLCEIFVWYFSVKLLANFCQIFGWNFCQIFVWNFCLIF